MAARTGTWTAGLTVDHSAVYLVDPLVEPKVGLLVGSMEHKPVGRLVACWAVALVDRKEHSSVDWTVDCSVVSTAGHWAVTLADNWAGLTVLQWAALKVD